jgi:hypothetical protein
VRGEEAGDARPGDDVVRLSWALTAVFVVCAIAATIAPGALGRPVAVLDGVLFAGGVVAFAGAYVRAVSRSRFEKITVTGVFLLSGSAPAEVRRSLLGALAVQSLVAVTTASIRLYSPVAFGVLVPVLGLGLAGWWGSRHGTFPPREGS